MINNKYKTKSGSGSSWESRDVDTRGRECPTNHPQFSAINCCQLRIGSCRPDLCRILGAFLHFPDNRNCGSQVICGGGGSLPFKSCSLSEQGKQTQTNKEKNNKRLLPSKSCSLYEQGEQYRKNKYYEKNENKAGSIRLMYNNSANKEKKQLLGGGKNGKVL